MTARYVIKRTESYALRHRATGTVIGHRRWDMREDAMVFLERLPAETAAELESWPVAHVELSLIDVEHPDD